MIVPTKNAAVVREYQSTSRDELDNNYKAALVRFDKALANKTSIDLIYVAAANEVNTLERQVRRLAHQDAVASRKAAKALVATAQAEV